jgi:opacity protein-like surface antigen
VDTQKRAGVDVDFVKNTWFCGVAMGIFYLWDDDRGSVGTGASAENADIEAQTWEFMLGARKVWYDLSEWFRPFVGVGAEYEYVDLDIGPESESQGFFGPWAEIGAYISYFDPITFGFQVRSSKLDVGLFGDDTSLFGQDVDPGGLDIAVSIGYRWMDL